MSKTTEHEIYGENREFWGVLMFLRHTKGLPRWAGHRKALIKDLTDKEKETLKRIVDREI